jgi:hypothetical protein
MDCRITGMIMRRKIFLVNAAFGMKVISEELATC